MNGLRRVDAGLARVEGWLLVAAVLGLLALGVTQIVMRFFGASFDWADEVMRNVTLWIGFIGASIATHQGKHLNIDALTRFFPAKARAVIAVVVQLAAAGICALLFWSAYKVVASSVARFGSDAGVVTAAGIPVALWQSIMPIAFALIGARCLLQAALALQRVLRGEVLVDATPLVAPLAVHPSPESNAGSNSERAP